MRMTNKIMQNNSLYNINNNKILQDKLSTMMSTEKKITRPSDDPVIAIRALRLRTNVTELTQFYEKNAPDAESWLDVTGKSLTTITAVLTDMITQANKGANKDYGPEDLEIVIEQLKSLKNEYYSTGNVDYAGRYIFTGYRTDTTMSFTKEVEEQPDGYPRYEITEQLNAKDFDMLNHTDIGDLDGLTKSNYTNGAYANVNEQQISNGDIHRLRLAYDNVQAGALEIRIGDEFHRIPSISLADDPYGQVMEANENGTSFHFFVPETGEILMSDAAYFTITSEIRAAGGDDAEVRITYTKDEWKDGDLRPEHYFACTAYTQNSDQTEKKVEYNQEYLNGNGKRQTIEYDVGYNQKIQVNTTADEVFSHDLDRDIDDLELALQDLKEINAIRKDLDVLLDDFEEGTDDYKDVKKKYDAADKAYSYIREKIHKMFEGTITKVQGYLDDTNVAITDNGTRSQRLSLISNRLMDQRTTFRTLQSENEDADIAEVAVQLTSTELTYNAALMATGKIMQTSLMNYI
ncbi:MAG: hypothetical protein K2N15_06990 [Lachnospiraceae bacterium]|nr:hypothetical protein [Lachnospiraceae bacterium]